MSHVTVAAAVLHDLTGYLRDRQIDLEPTLSAAGLGPPATWPARIDAALVGRVWQAAVAASGDPDLGLHTAVAFTPGALDIVGYVMLSCRTGREALERGARLLPLLNDGLSIELTSSAHAITVQLIVHRAFADAMGDSLRQAVESIMAGAVHQLRLLTERPLLPLAVSFCHAAPSTGLATHASLFGVVPQMAAATNALVLPVDPLAQPLRSSNPALLSAFEEMANEALAALSRTRTVSARVSRSIIDRLRGQTPTIAEVARELAMSPRSVQRALTEEGTSFQQLLDEARQALALRHLRDPNVTVAHVAWLVGFSEPAAFHRAFRRWTGRAPRSGEQPGE
jgi:AraC-like DNA-binding protein